MTIRNDVLAKLFIRNQPDRMKPHYRMTIIPKYLYWEVIHIWVLKHWGKRHTDAGVSQKKHMYCDNNDIIYYRID